MFYRLKSCLNYKRLNYGKKISVFYSYSNKGIVPTRCVTTIKFRGSLNVAKQNPGENDMAYPGFRFATSRLLLDLLP